VVLFACSVNHNESELVRALKNVLLAFAVTALFAGCATTEQFNALQARVTALESQVSSAADSASDAAAAAQQAGRDANSAKATAERAMDAATEANERAERVADTCCSRK
jgi:outer membrane murein-binding lipoprotein Lpp